MTRAKNNTNESLMILEEGTFSPYLTELKEKVPGIFYAIISTDDGFPVAYTDMDADEAMRKAAMSASLDGLSATLAMESRLSASGELDHNLTGDSEADVDATYVECGDRFIFGRRLQVKNRKLVLLAASKRSDSFATLHWNIRQTVEQICKELN